MYTLPQPNKAPIALYSEKLEQWYMDVCIEQLNTVQKLFFKPPNSNN